MTFSNEPIPIEDLPQLSADDFVPVDPRYLRASLAGFGLVAVVVVVVTAALAATIAEPVVLAFGAGILAIVAVIAWLRVLEVRRLGYQVRQHDLSTRRGLIVHRTSSLPFVRVQHVRVRRGAIERLLGLATLEVSSAGPDITIPGLKADDAERIKLLVTERAGDLEEAGGAADAQPDANPHPGPLTTPGPPIDD